MNRKVIVVTAVIVICLIFIPFIILIMNNDLSFERSYMFEDISECEKLCTLGYKGEKITKYEKPDKDKNIKNLKYKEFFGLKYESEEVEFEIFAYVFETPEGARQYFKNETGNDKLAINFSGSSGLTGPYRHIVLVNEKVYYITTPKKYVNETEKILSEVFSVDYEQIKSSS